MKAGVLKGLLLEGKKPVVRLTNVLWDEAFGQKGMIARVVGFQQDLDRMINLFFDYNENREHNLALDQPIWYLFDSDACRLGRKTGTAIEAHRFKNPNDIVENVYFEEGDEVPVELIGEGSLLAEYLASGSKGSYVEWLEATLASLHKENLELRKAKA